MIRAGVSERRRLAFTAELAALDAMLSERTVPQPELNEENGGPSYQESFQDTALSPVLHTLRIACPDDLHPAVSDAQLTVLLRDALEAQGNAALHPLLERVSWQLEQDDRVVLICTPRDLALVTAQLHMASWLALGALLPERLLSVTVRVGQPVPRDLRPNWLDAALWMHVPQWLRPVLVGSVLVDTCLYGATPERTADLAARAEVVQWLLDQVAGWTNGVASEEAEDDC